MAAQNFVLGYWKVLVGIVVAGLVGVLVYGQYSNFQRHRQQAYAADIAKVEMGISEIVPTLAFDPSLVTPEDMGKITSAATSYTQIGASASGGGATEAYMKAAELYRLLDKPEDQLAAYEGAIANAKGDLLFAAHAAHAALLLDTGASEASIAEWRELSTQWDGYLGAFATLQLARTLDSAGDSSGAVAAYDDLMSRFADSPLTETASDERSRLSTASPAPSAPAPVEEPAPVEAPAPTETP